MMNALRALFSGRALNADLGLLALRLGAGLSLMIFHGYGKISAGPDLWAKLGTNMEYFGITFAPTLWGFFAAFAEFFCSLFVVLGVAVRPAAALAGFTMLVAAIRHLNLPPDSAAHGWGGASHALEFLSAFLALLLAGPGRYTIVYPFARMRSRRVDGSGH